MIWPYKSNNYLHCRLNNQQTTILADTAVSSATFTAVAWQLIKT